MGDLPTLTSPLDRFACGPLLARTLPALRWQRAAARGDVAAVVLEAGAELPSPLVPTDLHEVPRGHRCGVLPRGAVVGATATVAPSVLAALDEPVEDDQVWCLVVAASGPLVVPVRLGPPSLSRRAPRGSA